MLWSLSWSSSLLIGAVIIRASSFLSLSTVQAPAGYRFLFSSPQPPYVTKRPLWRREPSSLLRSYCIMIYCGLLLPPAILISRLLLHMRWMNGILKEQFDHTCFDLLLLVIFSRVFWQSVKWNLHKAQSGSKSVCTSNRHLLHSITLGNY